MVRIFFQMVMFTLVSMFMASRRDLVNTNGKMGPVSRANFLTVLSMVMESGSVSNLQMRKVQDATLTKESTTSIKNTARVFLSGSRVTFIPVPITKTKETASAV